MTVRSGLIEANGTKLYHEVRGRGPSVLFIVGATGDGSWYERAAERLSDEFTTVLYDRRANSRSPRHPSWPVTTMAEQAEDAAALLEALGTGPAAAFGSSGGAVILIDLLLRRPDVLRGAILHEPPLIGVLEYGERVMAELQAQAESAMASGGPRAAIEAFVRGATHDKTFDALDPAMRERVLGNAETFFGGELQPMAGYLPDDADLAGLTVPVFVAAGVENTTGPNRYLYDASVWTAEAIGTDLIEFPGAHVSYYEQPDEFVQAVRPMLHKMS